MPNMGVLELIQYCIWYMGIIVMMIPLAILICLLIWPLGYILGTIKYRSRNTDTDK